MIVFNIHGVFLNSYVVVKYYLKNKYGYDLKPENYFTVRSTNINKEQLEEDFININKDHDFPAIHESFEALKYISKHIDSPIQFISSGSSIVKPYVEKMMKKYIDPTIDFQLYFSEKLTKIEKLDELGITKLVDDNVDTCNEFAEDSRNLSYCLNMPWNLHRIISQANAIRVNSLWDLPISFLL